MSLAPPVVNLRTTLGRPLTWAEEDASFSNIRDFCNSVGQLFNPDGSIDPTLLQSVLVQYIASQFIGSTSPFLSPVGTTIWTPVSLGTGVILPTNGASWLRGDGSIYNQSDYPKLFALLGHTYDSDATIVGVAVHALTNTHIATVAVHSGGGGTGYVVNDVLTISGGTGTAATVKVTGVSGGVINAISVLTCGDYTANPTLTSNAATGGTGTGASLDLTTFAGGGGTGYVVGDILTVVGGTGAAASVQVTAVNLTSVTTVAVATFGNYSAAPSTPNTPIGGSGTGASLDLTFSSTVNPATQFRVPLLDGSFLFGADSQFLVGAAGGEKLHKLLAAESGLPDHTHSLVGFSMIAGSNFNSGGNNDRGGAVTGTVTGGAKAAAQSHQNMPPFRSGLYYLLAGYRVAGAWV